DLEVIVSAVRSRPDAQHGNLHRLADLDALQHFVERRLAKRLFRIAGPAEPELRVGPGVDVAGGDAHAELGQVAALRALDRGVVDVAVERLFEHALVNLNGVVAWGFRSAALPLKIVGKRGAAGVRPGRPKRTQKSPADQWPTLIPMSMVLRKSSAAGRSR